LRELGRKVPDFDDAVWAKERYAIVIEANYLMFTQNAELRQQLLGERELVEASARDRIWGVGFGTVNAGLNLLGKALMDTRTRLRQEAKNWR
jgi:ribA/ribD-fused uncharacterized protein